MSTAIQETAPALIFLQDQHVAAQRVPEVSHFDELMNGTQDPIERVVANLAPHAAEAAATTAAEVERSVKVSMLGELSISAEAAWSNITARSKKIAAGVGTLAAVGAFAAAPATAETAPVAPSPVTSITELNKNITIKVGKSEMSTSAFAKATVMANMQTKLTAKQKKQVRNAEKNGKCETIDGKKEKIYTQGRVENGVAPGRDTRTSRFCNVGGVLRRVACWNKAWVGKKPKKAVENVVWVKDASKASITVKAKSSAKAQAQCKSIDGTVSAFAYGAGEGSATGTLRVKQALKVKARALKELVIRKDLEASGSAKSTASAKAVVQCASAEVGGPGIPPPVTTPNRPLTADIVGQEHSLPSDRVEVCAYVRDEDGQDDIISRAMTETGVGEWTSDIRPGDEVGEICRDLFVGTQAGTVSVAVAAMDKAGNKATDSANWQVIPEPAAGEPGGF